MGSGRGAATSGAAASGAHKAARGNGAQTSEARPFFLVNVAAFQLDGQPTSRPLRRKRQHETAVTAVAPRLRLPESTVRTTPPEQPTALQGMRAMHLRRAQPRTSAAHSHAPPPRTAVPPPPCSRLTQRCRLARIPSRAGLASLASHPWRTFSHTSPSCRRKAFQTQPPRSAASGHRHNTTRLDAPEPFAPQAVPAAHACTCARVLALISASAPHAPTH